MKKIILLSLVCVELVITMPFAANALETQEASQSSDKTTNGLLAQYRRNYNRQFSVYYRNRGDRQWIFEGYHDNRRDAQRAANRLERRGYRTYIQVSRRINSGMRRG